MTISLPGAVRLRPHPRDRFIDVAAVSASAPTFTPASISGLQAWYKPESLALSDGAAVTAWPDSSGNGRTLVQASAPNQPTFKTGLLNGLGGVRFNGAASTYLRYTAGAAFVSGTVLTLAFSIIRRTNQAGGRAVTLHNTAQGNDYTDPSEMILFSGGSGDRLNTYRASSLTDSLFSAVTSIYGLVWFDGTLAHQRVNGADIATPTAASAGTFSIDDILLGTGFQTSAPSGGVSDDIVEVAVYNTVPTSGDRTSLESYFHTRTGI